MDDTNKQTSSSQIVDRSLQGEQMSNSSNAATSGLGDANANPQEDSQLDSAREDLKAVLQVGLTVQMITVIVAFAIKKGKEDFLKQLNDLILDLNTKLTEEEKKELQADTNTMIETKAEDLVESLGEQLSEEELKTTIEEMKQIAQSAPQV